MKDNIFRKEALKKHSAPDNTDQLIVLPRLSYWIGLAILLIIVVTLFVCYTQLILYIIVEGDGIFQSNLSESIGNSSSNQEVILFINYYDGHKILPGMKVHISPLTMEMDEFSYIEGTVTKILLWPASKYEVASILNNNTDLADFIMSKVNGPPYLVYVSLNREPDDPDSYILSAQVNDEIIAMPSTPCHGRIIIKQSTVQEKFFQLSSDYDPVIR